MTMRVLRRRHRAKMANGAEPALCLTLRADVPVRPGMRARYSLGVADRQIDRSAWARVVQDLIATETRGKVATFAGRVGVDPRTVRHWLAGTVGVSEESVRKVAAGTKRHAMDLLVQVGYYDHTEVGPPVDGRDEELELVRDDPRLTPALKKRIIDQILERRQRSIEETRRLIEMLSGDGNV